MCDTKVRLNGRVAIVSGGSSGLGLETARKLAKNGARVIIASRNKAKLEKAKRNIISDTGNLNIDYGQIDLASLKSVRSFANYIIQNESRLDILINNVGALGLPDKLTEDGLHVMMQVNYFGAFLLTYLLLPLLKASPSSKVINVSAASLYIGQIDFDHLNDVGRWSTINLLANGKLAESLFTVELARRVNGTGVTANTYDPFLVSGTGILENMPAILRNVGRGFVDIIGRNKKEVAREIVFLASDPKLNGVTGRHFKFCTEWLDTWLAFDDRLREKLWDESKRLVKITPEEDWET